MQSTAAGLWFKHWRKDRIGVQVHRKTQLENPGKASEIAGVAMGVVDASIHTLVTQEVIAPVLFDETHLTFLLCCHEPHSACALSRNA
jgi:hypothetical protein